MAILAGYLFLVLSTTVLSRPVKAEYEYMLMPFWSYTAILEGQKDLLAENIANIIMLVPVGFLLPIVLKSDGSRPDGKKVVLIGFLFSSSIELLQLILKRGLFEFDDIVHNTAGCLVGYMIYRLVYG
ncbi:MAG: VanZ family protein [Lachnospiraceae bacterium]|nr:VanZ family protein [Lachnospiraceae bacterium]